MEYLDQYLLSQEEKEHIKALSDYFYETVRSYGSDPYGLIDHLGQLQKWANFVLVSYTDLNPFVLFLSIWGHDIGHYPIQEEDHAITGERIVRHYLEGRGVDSETILSVAHCIRSHRNRDVVPQTLEAKMMACIDSASHLTDPLMYGSIIQGNKFDYLDGKIERDYRDVQDFPLILSKVDPFYQAWKQLIQEHKKFIS